MNTRILIPAAGFGKRVGSPVAKELLLHPKTGRPLIQEAVDKAKTLGEPLVITRLEKKELVSFLVKNNINFQLIDETREWPDTILSSKEYWLGKNLVLLPDTDYLPHSIAEDLLLGLESPEISVTLGVFKVNDFTNWGMIDSSLNTLCIADKPLANKKHSLAWGILAFRIEDGDTLFQAISASNRDKLWKETDLKFKSYDLQFFQDLTR